MSKFLEERVANPGKYVYVPFAPTNPGVIVRRISTNRVQVKFVNTLLGKKQIFLKFMISMILTH